MKRNDNFVLRQVADKHVLMPAEGTGFKHRGRITMSESGALIWNLLSSERTLEQLVGAVMGEYDVSPEEAEADIRAFLLQMSRLQLLTVS